CRAPVAALLVNLGQFARDRDLPAWQDLPDRREGFREPWRGLEEKQCSPHRTQLRERFGASLLFARQEPGEQEAVARQARQSQSDHGRTRTGQAGDRDAPRAPFADQLVTGIGDKRRARVADQRDRLARQGLEQTASLLGSAVIVIPPQRLGNSEMTQELAGHARIFAGDRVATRKHVERAPSHVAEVAYRGGDDVEARRKRFGSIGVAHAVPCGPHHEEAASMLAITRRALAVGLLTLFLAACKVVPDSGRPGPQPLPTPEGPSEDVLPTDTARHRVALLVPLSGNNAAVGRSIANATTMALLDTNAENLRITTYDTATGADSAAARAISDGNKLILGPLLRENVAPVLARARPADVPLVTFSNDTSVAEPDVFVMGHVPEQSIARTVGYARAQGARRFAALIPEGDYGRRASEALSQSVSRNNGTIVAVERYDRGNTSIVSAAERLKANGGYDAVLIADGARLAAMAAGALKEG